MEIKKNSIIRRISTNEIYEVVEITGTILLCKSINIKALKNFKESKIPLRLEEVELMMDIETDTLNILFGENE